MPDERERKSAPWLRPDDVSIWSAKVRELMKDAAEAAGPVADALGISRSGFSGYLNGNEPSLKAIVALADRYDYTVAEQVSDLTGRQRDHLVPVSEEEAAFASRLELFRRIDGALEVAGQRGPSVSDMVRGVLRSCENEAPLVAEGLSTSGRWRARTFDVPMGWRFPHVGYHGVEFMRWYGPNRGPADDVLSAYPSSDWWRRRGSDLDRVKRMTDALWFRPEAPANFYGRPDEWNEFRAERLELVHRMGPQYARARLSTYGQFGNQHRALLRHADSPGLRHIFTQMTPNTTPDYASSIPSGWNRDAKTFIVVGHPSARPIAVGARLAEAMGWQLTEFRQLQARLTGARPHAAQHVAATAGNRRSDVDLTWSRLSGISATRDRPLVLPVSSTYMFHGQGPDAQISAAARQAMADPNVAVIVLSTPMDVGHDEWQSSAELWEQRTRTITSSGTAPMTDRRKTAERAPDLIAAAASPDRLLRATVLPTYLHYGPAYFPGAAPDARGGPAEPHPAFLWHPTVGDIDVRAAFEIGHLLAAGTEIGRRQSTVTFAEGSVVRRHVQDLRRLTGDSHWNPAKEQHARHAETHFMRPAVARRITTGDREVDETVSAYYGVEKSRAVRFD